MLDFGVGCSFSLAVEGEMSSLETYPFLSTDQLLFRRSQRA